MGGIQVPDYYRQRVKLGGLPTVRENQRIGPEDFGAGVAQGFAQAGAGMSAAYEREHRKQQSAALMGAYGQLSDADLQIRDGFASLKGEAAVVQSKGGEVVPRSSAETAIQNFDARVAAIREALPSEDVRLSFDEMAIKRREAFHGFLDDHVAKQTEVVAVQKYQSASNAAANDAAHAALSGNLEEAQQAVDTGRQAAEVFARNTGGDVEAESLKATTAGNVAIVNALLAGDRPATAAEYLKDEGRRKGIDSDVLAKLDDVVGRAVSKRQGAELARIAVDQATTTAIRSWNTAPVAKVDASKVAARLERELANPKMPEDVKEAMREHADAEVRAQQAAFKGAVDDTYHRAVTKLESNGWRLSELGEEKAFLLDPKVDAGDVWAAIRGRVEQERHRRSGATKTPAQEAAMAQFWWTLPQREQGYRDPGYSVDSFMQEWGPKLHPNDLEQAASYLGRSGVTANRPDETLPPAVVSQINATGADAGLWGAKGPKSPEQVELRLLVQNDLLQRQAEARRLGKPLDEATVKERLDYWTTKGTIPGSGILGTKFLERDAARAEATREGLPFLEEGAPRPPTFDSVPDEHRDSILRALKKHNRPTTEDWMLWAWRQEMKRQGNYDGPNPLPAERTPAAPAPAPGRRGTY